MAMKAFIGIGMRRLWGFDFQRPNGLVWNPHPNPSPICAFSQKVAPDFWVRKRATFSGVTALQAENR